jgi:WhiB family redox-sensing transcriptional regulator
MIENRESVRTHDAVWIIQRELAYNDYLLQKERRLQRKRGRAAVDIQDVPEVDEATKDAARRVLAGIAAEAGATADDLREALDMAGLLPDSSLATTYTAIGNRRTLNGECRRCGRSSISVRVDGTLISHTPKPGMELNDDTRCPGSGQQARELADVVPITASQRQPHPAATGGRARSKALPDGRGACQDADPELFFPSTYGPGSAAQVAAARGVCGRCDFARACLRAALDQPGVDGIWAGTTPRQRGELRSQTAALTERTSA